jgi:hypothetical protein
MKTRNLATKKAYEIEKKRLKRTFCPLTKENCNPNCECYVKPSYVSVNIDSFLQSGPGPDNPYIPDYQPKQGRCGLKNRDK